MTDFRIVKHCAMGRDSDIMLSPVSGFWAGCPLSRVNPEDSAYEIFDDFTSFSVGDTTSKWTLDHTNSTAVLVSAEATTGVGGVVAITTGGVAEDFAQIKVTSTDTGAPFRLLDATTGRDLWFAVRVYVSSIADISFYFGLFNQAATEVGTDNTGALHATTAIDGIYFRTLNATPTEIDWGCAKNNTETEVAGAAGTLAATTWTTLGFKYDASQQAVIPYQDGVSLGYAMSTSLTNFPDDQGLTPLVYIKEGAGAAKVLNVDWIRCIQKRLA